jgi:DNA-binding NarL/FixJ family response regulator
MTTMVDLTRIMCVDDNVLVRETLERKFTAAEGFTWCGALSDTAHLLELASACQVEVILLEPNVGGPDPFLAIALLARELPSARVIVLSTTTSVDLLDKAFNAGAWGYLSKADRSLDIVRGAQRVAGGEFAMGPEVLSECRSHGFVEPVPTARAAAPRNPWLRRAAIRPSGRRNEPWWTTWSRRLSPQLVSY